MLFRVHASSSAGNLCTFEDEGAIVALDCGTAPRNLAAALGWRVAALDAALISHHHADHCRCVPALLRSGVDVYASAECLSALELAGHHRAIAAQAGVPLEIPGRSGGGRWRVLPFELHHDAPGTLGFLVERRGPAGDCRGRLLYACDTAYIPHLFRNLTHIAVECNYSEALLLASAAPAEQRVRVLKSHLSLERLLEWLGRMDLGGVEEIHLLHLSAAHSDAVAFREAVAAATGRPVRIGPVGAPEGPLVKPEQRRSTKS